MDINYNSQCHSDYPQEECKVALQSEALWKQFHESETEMIITKTGRRMFPPLRVQLSGLEPLAHYCLLLEFGPASNCRYKYSTATGWMPGGSEEAHSPNRVYLHPESPATGEHWMSQPVSFGRAKLTNTVAPPMGHVVLSSMHKYQPRVIIVKTTDPRNIVWAPSTTVAFPETQFIAVTAYQNEEITKLKIDNNPFAKGFRENGQSRCKRKVREKTENPKIEEKTEIKNESGESTGFPDDQQSSPPSPCRERVMEPESPKTIARGIPHFYPAYNYHYQYKYPFMALAPSYELPPYYFPPAYSYPSPWTSTYGLHPMPLRSDCNIIGQSQKPKRLTDFSIRAITGL